MSAKKTINSIFDFFRSCYAQVSYLMYKIQKNFTIYDSVSTIDYIIKNNVSVSRFGDGEFLIMKGKGMGFQRANPELACRLIEVLSSTGSCPHHIVCLPYSYQSLEGLTLKAKKFWLWNIAWNRQFLIHYIPSHRRYFDASFTRFYLDVEDKKSCPNKISMIKQIWESKDVVIVEGKGTRLGIGNDLLNNAKLIKRILCPSQNAFSKYDEIRDYIIRNVSRDNLILCALGMTATVLAFDLCKHGYQAIDIGHIDIEYEWYLKQVTERCPIEGKSVNECDVNNPDDITAIEYQQQIIYKID